MGFSHRILASVCLAVLTSGCATFGTNIEGDFTCRAPKGDCAPTHVIDAKATNTLPSGTTPHAETRPRSGVVDADTTRTAERTLRVVFPAHVDEAGTLHDEAVAWTVVDNPRWATELRRKAGEDKSGAMMRQVRRQLKAAQAASAHEDADEHPDATADLASPFSSAPTDRTSAFDTLGADAPSSEIQIPDASPLVLPSTAREAVAGAKAPAVEGFDMSPPLHDRTPRPGGKGPLTYPSVEAIEAAKATKRADTGTTSAPAPIDEEPK